MVLKGRETRAGNTQEQGPITMLPTKIRTIQHLALACAFLLAGLFLGPIEVNAQAMADYTAYPPFFGADSVPPNILLLI
ncbi:MAG: hypothetical protein ACREIO_01780, partial [Nitrospiraceae bacterium]